jgi:hypothetical protein
VAKKLELIFKNAADRTAKITVDDVREDITPTEVKTAMETIIAKNVFTSNGGDLAGIHGARIVDTNIQELELA